MFWGRWTNGTVSNGWFRPRSPSKKCRKTRIARRMRRRFGELLSLSLGGDGGKAGASRRTPNCQESFSMESPRRITPPSRTRHNMPRRPHSSLRSPGRIASVWSQGVHTALTSRRAPPIWSCWPICRLFTFMPSVASGPRVSKMAPSPARPPRTAAPGGRRRAKRSQRGPQRRRAAAVFDNLAVGEADLTFAALGERRVVGDQQQACAVPGMVLEQAIHDKPAGPVIS